MRVVLSTYDSRGGVEPLAGLGVPMVPFGDSVRDGDPGGAAVEAELRQQMDELIAAVLTRDYPRAAAKVSVIAAQCRSAAAAS